MPELPEVETVARGVWAAAGQRRVAAVDVRRAGVVTGPRDSASLLGGQRIADVQRHGKQLALIGDAGGVVCVHLGMSGQVLCKHTGTANDWPTHTHVVWTLDDGSAVGFRDPRRFGGLWTFGSLDALRESRWSRLGPDALAVTDDTLRQRLRGTRRGLKAALLDQAVVAGLGNIYVDEALFRARLHPLKPACSLRAPQAAALGEAVRGVLSDAVAAGGSTLRDYVQTDGVSGGFQAAHRVYGRAGLPCVTCAAPLRAMAVTQRTTVWCPRCQRLPRLTKEGKKRPL